MGKVVIRYHVMKACEAVEVRLHAFVSIILPAVAGLYVLSGQEKRLKVKRALELILTFCKRRIMLPWLDIASRLPSHPTRRLILCILYILVLVVLVCPRVNSLEHEIKWEFSSCKPT